MKILGLPFTFLKKDGENGFEYYVYENCSEKFTVCFAPIGLEHPFIDNPGNTVWYPAGENGIYITGYDKVRNKSFAPILSDDEIKELNIN